MELIRSFSKLNKNNVSIAGGKGASLGELTHAGIAVPQGFVVLSNAFEQFLEENELIAEIDSILHSVDTEKMHTVENASEEIHSLILNAKIPKEIEKEILKEFKKLNAKFVAVRSSATAEDSATAAWAGQLETFLNTTQKNLLENVKKCWASLFSPRAIFYRKEKNLHNQKISVAVVVQKMIQSETSGIAFSVHPVTQDRNQLIIEAGYGLGEAIVSGQITPDSYIVEKNNFKIIENKINEQAKKLERTSKGNEWIDIPKTIEEKQKLSGKEIIELSKLIIRIENHYGFPVDIEWAKEKGKFYILQSRPITTLTLKEKQTSFELPIDPKDEIFRWGPVPFRYFYAADYLYALTTGYSCEYMDNYWPRVVAIFRDNEFVWVHNFAQLREIGGQVFQRNVLTEKYKQHKKRWYSVLKKLHKLEKRITTKNLKQLNNSNLTALLRETNAIARDFWLPTLPAELGNYGSIELLQKELRLLINNVGVIGDITRILTTPEKLSFYQEEEIALQLTKNIHQHQQKYFWLHNSYAGVEFLTDDFFQKRKEMLKPNLQKEHAERIKKIKEDKQFIIRKYNISKDLQTVANRIVDAMEWQDERKKETWILQYYKQLLLNEVQKRTGASNLDIFGLWELTDLLAGSKLKRAKSFGFILDQGNMIELDIETSEEYWNIYTKEKIEDINQFSGIIANRGHAIGKATIVRDPKKKAQLFEEGDILVAPMTSPDYVFLMKKSSAVVTDAGGLTSHAAIISRELKKPCIIGTKIATQVLKDGDLVEVNANKGTIKILKRIK